MIRYSSPLLLIATLVLAGCGGSEPAGQSTTKLDAVEVQPGTISDSMIILDSASADGTAIDNSDPEASAKKGASSEEPQSAGSEENDEGEAEESEGESASLSAPVAKKAASKGE